MDDDMLPCPFCGGSAEWEYYDWIPETGDGDDGTGMVSCTSCGIGTPRTDRDDALSLWNSRVSLPE